MHQQIRKIDILWVNMCSIVKTNWIFDQYLYFSVGQNSTSSLAWARTVPLVQRGLEQYLQFSVGQNSTSSFAWARRVLLVQCGLEQYHQFSVGQNSTSSLAWARTVLLSLYRSKNKKLKYLCQLYGKPQLKKNQYFAEYITVYYSFKIFRQQFKI